MPTTHSRLAGPRAAPPRRRLPGRPAAPRIAAHRGGGSTCSCSGRRGASARPRRVAPARGFMGPPRFKPFLSVTHEASSTRPAPSSTFRARKATTACRRGIKSLVGAGSAGIPCIWSSPMHVASSTWLFAIPAGSAPATTCSPVNSFASAGFTTSRANSRFLATGGGSPGLHRNRVFLLSGTRH